MLLIWSTCEFFRRRGGSRRTSVCHHDFLDGFVLGLRGGVGRPGVEARPPDGQQAEAASDDGKLEHPEEEKSGFKHKVTFLAVVPQITIHINTIYTS